MANDLASIITGDNVKIWHIALLIFQASAGLDYESSYGKARPNDTILKLQRTTPYYKRNRAHVCSFYVRGECTRGAECPYRHEMPVTGELSQQNIKDRYYGYSICQDKIFFSAKTSKYQKFFLVFLKCLNFPNCHWSPWRSNIMVYKSLYYTVNLSPFLSFGTWSA